MHRAKKPVDRRGNARKMGNTSSADMGPFTSVGGSPRHCRPENRIWRYRRLTRQTETDNRPVFGNAVFRSFNARRLLRRPFCSIYR